MTDKVKAVSVSPSTMEVMGTKEDGDISSSVRTAEILTRLVPMALSVVALVLMLKTSQTNEFGSLSYSDVGAFRYLVHANGICASYSLLSAIITAVPRLPTMSRAWTFFFLDQVFTYVILAAGAASVEILYLAYKGDAATTWTEECGSFGSYCHRATSSVVITFVVVVFYSVLSIISSYRLFSKFDAPVNYHSKGIDIAAFHS